MNQRKYALYLLITATVAVVGMALAFRPMPTLLTASGTRSTTTAATNSEERVPANPDTVRISIEGSPYIVKVATGTPLIEAMREAKSEGLQFTGKEYPSLGFFVDTINGKKGEDGYYWFLYVNDKKSNMGASQTRLEPGDRVEWKLEAGY